MTATLISPTLAQTQQEVDWCVNKEGAFSPDVAIKGCTASIDSGRWSGRDLVWAFKNRANAYLGKSDYSRAIADMTEALRLDPYDASILAGRGRIYHDKDDYDRAIGDYSEAIRLDPNDASTFYDRGNVYYLKKDYERAIADYHEAIKLNPKYVNAYTHRGDGYLNKSEYD